MATAAQGLTVGQSLYPGSGGLKTGCWLPGRVGVLLGGSLLFPELTPSSSLRQDARARRGSLEAAPLAIVL